MPFDRENIPPQNNASIKEHRAALVIGNGRYTHAAPLANPINDAEALASMLERLGFEVVKGFDLELRAMGRFQAAFEAKLRSKPDVAMLFYAGHGLQVRGKNYLIPIDAQISEVAHLASEAILFNDILEPMTEDAGASLVFLDACRDNPFSRNLMRTLGESSSRSNLVRGGLATIEKMAGTFIAYATAPDAIAFDGKNTNSPFTSALLKHIATPGLSIADMMIDVRNSVLAETNGRQEPWDQSSLRKRFYFLPKSDAPPVRPIVDTPADEWHAIQYTDSLAVVARFKERYPTSPWSDYADARTADIRANDKARRMEIGLARQNEPSLEHEVAKEIERSRWRRLGFTTLFISIVFFILSSATRGDGLILLSVVLALSSAWMLALWKRR